jgi:hypothetical protein
MTLGNMRQNGVRGCSSPAAPTARSEHGTTALTRGLAHMRMEFLHGRLLSREELELIRRQIEKGFDDFGAVDDEIRPIVARNWPDLVSKLPPQED